MSEHSRRKKARDVLTRSGYSVGGHLGRPSDGGADKHEIEEGVKRGIAEHEAHDHKGEKRTRIRLRDGGTANGYAAGGRPDKKSRKGKTEVNVMVAGQQPPQKVPVPVPVPAHPPMAAGAPGMPPGAPPGLPPGGPPPGLRPGMGPMKDGGRAKAMKMRAGAGSGEGRIEKAEHEAKRAGGHR